MAEKLAKRRQEEIFLVALLEGRTIAEAAKQAGISETTAYRWLRDPDFQQRYKAAKEELVQRVLDRLIALGEAAANTLRDILTSGEGEGNRLQAARLVLNTLLEGVAYQQLEERLTRLEERLAGGER